MTNAQRREIVNDAKARGYEGSYVDLFRQAAVDPQQVVRHGTQASMDGLRPAHQAGNTEASMAFTDVPPNTPFNTVGMKKPIDIKKYDRQGHLVKSYESVPPGIQALDTGPNTGTVIETPARMQGGDFKEKSGLSPEDYETKYNQAVQNYGTDVALAFDPQTQDFRPGNAFLQPATVVTKVDRDEKGTPVFKSEMAKDRYYATKNIGEAGNRQMREAQTAVNEARGKFAENYLAPAAAAMLGFEALPVLAAAGPYLAAAGETTYGALAPTIGATMNAPIAGLPGITGSNLMTAGFASDFLVNRAPKIPGQISSGEYMAAAENVGVGALDLMGLKGASRMSAGLKATSPAGKTSSTGEVPEGFKKVYDFVDEKMILPIQKMLPSYKRQMARNKAAMYEGDRFAREYYANPRTRKHLEEIGEELAPVKTDDPFITPMAGQTKEGLAQAQRVIDNHEDFYRRGVQSVADKLQLSGMDATKAKELAKADFDSKFTYYNEARKHAGMPHRVGDTSKFTKEELAQAARIREKELPYSKTDFEAYHAVMYQNRGDVGYNHSDHIPSLAKSLVGMADDAAGVRRTTVEPGVHDYAGVYKTDKNLVAAPYVSEAQIVRNPDPAKIRGTAAHEVTHGVHSKFDLGVSTANSVMDEALSKAVDPSLRHFTKRGKYTPYEEDPFGYFADRSELKSRTMEMRESISKFFPATLKKQEAGQHALQVGNWDALSIEDQRKLTRRLMGTKAGDSLNRAAFQTEKYYPPEGTTYGSNEHIDFVGDRFKYLLRYAPAATGAAAVGAAQMEEDEPKSGLRRGGMKDRRKSRVSYNKGGYRK